MTKVLSLKNTTLASLVTATLFFGSCTKDSSLNQPVADQLTNVDDGQLQHGELAEKKPSPGVYKIGKFIDTGGDETAQFNGYTFNFKANGVLVATTGAGKVFNGSWQLNSAQTFMEINIAGNNALDDLDDDDWKVDAITNKRIRISAPGPDSVGFVKL